MIGSTCTSIVCSTILGEETTNVAQASLNLTILLCTCILTGNSSSCKGCHLIMLCMKSWY